MLRVELVSKGKVPGPLMYTQRELHKRSLLLVAAVAVIVVVLCEERGRHQSGEKIRGALLFLGSSLFLRSPANLSCPGLSPSNRPGTL